MAFEQVLALNNQLAERWQAKSDSEGLNAAEAEEQAWDALDHEVRQLISDDPERATELMRRLAQSESKYDRQIAAYNVDELCTVDIWTGTDLWIRLLLDDEAGEAAWSTINDRFDPQRHSRDEVAYMFMELAESLRGWYGAAKAMERDQGAS